jgi:hypothetical protein
MSDYSADDRVRRAEEALAQAEKALRELEGEFQPSARNIAASTGVINGNLVRIVSIVSEKNARE